MVILLGKSTCCLHQAMTTLPTKYVVFGGLFMDLSKLIVLGLTNFDMWYLNKALFLVLTIMPSFFVLLRLVLSFIFFKLII